VVPSQGLALLDPKLFVHVPPPVHSALVLQAAPGYVPPAQNCRWAKKPAEWCSQRM
jgi:hypothetical protein